MARVMPIAVVILFSLCQWGLGLNLCHPMCHCLDTYFDCRRRGLESFPSDFPPWIQTLNLSSNAIKEINTDDLLRLDKLISLSLDGNNLTSIPKAEMHYLTQLSISRNNIESIENLEGYSSLRELDLSRNKISFLNNASFPLNLRYINLAGNQIEMISPTALEGLLSLKELHINKNKIRYVPKELFTFTNRLEKLDLSRNKLEILESLRFQDLKELVILNLRKNHLKNLSDATFYGLDKLEHLHLDGNEISTVEKRWLYGLRALRSLNISNNHLSRMEDNCWEYMDQLTHLDLSHNTLRGLTEKELVGLSRLRQLDLSYNAISTLAPDTFLPLRNLQILYLHNNKLSWPVEDTSGPFKGLESCGILDLSANELEILHADALDGLFSLKIIHLSSNPLRTLSPYTFTSFPNVIIDLHDINSFVCDCNATWLHSHLRKQKKRFSAPVCAFPDELKGRVLTELHVHELVCSPHERARFVKHPQTQTILRETNGTVSCIVASPAALPVKVLWRKDHEKLSPGVEERVERVERKEYLEITSTLNLVNVTWANGGEYQCLIDTNLGKIYSEKANITVHSFPTFIKRPANITVRLGSSARLECSARGFPSPEIAFQKDGGENFPAALERRFHVVISDDSFIIMNVKLEDMGTYCCRAKNLAGDIKACASVTVYERPSLRAPHTNMKVIQGSTTALECEASGWPRRQITWLKGNSLIKDNPPRVQKRENGSLLLIREATMEDAGRYECILINPLGTAKSSLVLTVIPKDGDDKWSTALIIISLVIIAALCVLATVAAWLVVIFRDRSTQSPKNSTSSIPDPTHNATELPVANHPLVNLTETGSFPDEDWKDTLNSRRGRAVKKVSIPLPPPLLFDVSSGCSSSSSGYSTLGPPTSRALSDQSPTARSSTDV